MVLKKVNKYFYNSFILKKLINNLSKHGNTDQVENILFSSLSRLKFKVKLNPLLLLIYLINEVKPSLKLQTLKLGSVTYKIPVPLSFKKQSLKAVKLLKSAVKHNKEGICLEKILYKEFLLILQKKSSLFLLMKEVYKVASTNRVLAHYRWN